MKKSILLSKKFLAPVIILVIIFALIGTNFYKVNAAKTLLNSFKNGSSEISEIKYINKTTVEITTRANNKDYAGNSEKAFLTYMSKWCNSALITNIGLTKNNLTVKWYDSNKKVFSTCIVDNSKNTKDLYGTSVEVIYQ